MVAKIFRLPKMNKRRRRVDLAKQIVRCEVSSRWLQFPSEAPQFSEGAFVTIDVITDRDFDGRARKICELVVTREDLVHVIERIKVVPPRGK